MMIKLKNILTEGYAWERRANGSLPTLKDVQEAYDAKGVEEAEDKADKDYDGDGEVESGSDEYLGSRDKAIKANLGKGTDMDVLNMGSLEESTFWGRVKGNLHGHEYILRESFRKK